MRDFYGYANVKFLKTVDQYLIMVGQNECNENSKNKFRNSL